MNKILMISHFYHPHVGGVEKHLNKIINILIKADYKVDLITLKYETKLKEIDKINSNFTIYRIPTNNKRYLGLVSIWLWFLKNLSLLKSADIIHIHDVFIWFLPTRFLLPFKKVFMTFHGYESYPLSKKAIFYRRLASWFTQGNICVGNFIPKWYGIKPTIVTYGAVDKSNINDKLKISYDAVFVGRLDEQTGITTYADAVDLIREKYPNFKFLILGDGKFKKQLQKKYICKGFVRNPEIFLNQSKFAFVSRYLAILEAFIAKRLLFAVYDNPIKRDYLRLTPFKDLMIICKDSKELTEEVVYYLNNTYEAKEKINKAYKWANDQTWEKMVENYEQLWFSKK